jgi:hypothetical protein
MSYARPLLLAAACTFGLVITSCAVAEDEGMALFDAQCANCHGARDITWWAEQYPDEDERRAWLDRFLQRHYPPSEEERALIVEHIEAVIAEE